jgi:hypothetical protein
MDFSHYAEVPPVELKQLQEAATAAKEA